jgi:hypothetical protein
MSGALPRSGAGGPDVSSSTRDWLAGRRATRPATIASSKTQSGVVADFVARFRQGTGMHLSAERFDAAAARLYFEADDPNIFPDQEHAIRQLLKRRREQVSSPHVQSYEEQDPRFGKWTMALLTSGRYGDLKLANNSYLHLNSPPTSLPPPVVDLHLCWGVRFQGAPTASVLHGVAALLLDDWRAALAGVNVRFHACRLGPVPASQALGRGGRRWRRREPSRLPPASVVGLLFARANRASALEPLAWHGASAGRRSWRCACLLEADLPALGFEPSRDRLRGEDWPEWTASTCTLPSSIHSVVVVPSSPGAGAFYRVVPAGRGSRLVSLGPGRAGVPVAHWARLRVQALDMALAELHVRMR